MIYIIAWLVLSYVVGLMGVGKTIRFWPAFILSLILSPLVGFIIVLVSNSNVDVEARNSIYEDQRRQIHEQQKQNEALATKIIEAKAPAVNTSLTEELQRLKQLKDDGVLTDDEFQTLKQKLLS